MLGENTLACFHIFFLFVLPAEAHTNVRVHMENEDEDDQ